MLTRFLNKRGVLFIGLSLQSLGALIAGRDSLWGHDAVTLLVVAGIAIFGLGTGMTAIPNMPEILDAIEEAYKSKGIKTDEFYLYNHIAGYFVMCQGLGETLGPMTSSLLEKQVGFTHTQYFQASSVGAFLLVYLFACGAKGFFYK